MFKICCPFPGVTHITDEMGAGFTLAEGMEKAILFDTGYGTEDIASFVSTLTKKPLTVLLSHGHHDHILGTRWFHESFLSAEDIDEFRERAGRGQRKKILKQAEDRGITLPCDFLTAEMPVPKPIQFNDITDGFETLRIDLGAKTAWVFKVPGHTPGSIVLFIPENDLLMTGDNWNPCTWMWFPSSVSAQVWRENMKTLIMSLEKRSGKQIRHVICPHQPEARKGEELKQFLDYMTDKQMAEAPETDMGVPIDTHQITEENHGWVLVFDKKKINDRHRKNAG